VVESFHVPADVQREGHRYQIRIVAPNLRQADKEKGKTAARIVAFKGPAFETLLG